MFKLREKVVLRDDPYLEAGEGRLDFRLTYAGRLLAHQDTQKLRERSLHVHSIRKAFHRQLKALWASHPVLLDVSSPDGGFTYVGAGIPRIDTPLAHDGFNWLPLVTEVNGLICKVDILMLRHGDPGRVVYDIDNRLKTLFDALRMAKGPYELGVQTRSGQVGPDADEDPFYVVMQDDRLITHLSVTTDTLLEPVPNVPVDEAVRLILDVTIRPYRSYPETSGFA
jgi:hypothetical protein